MKKQFLSALFCLSTSIMIFAQTSPPELISYQGIARDAQGNPLVNKLIGIQLNLLSTGGSTVFTEVHSVTTNSLGLFTLQIGSVNTSGFQTIDWSNGPYFLEVLMDPTGGTSYVPIGQPQQLLSVPYALYAKKAKLANNVINTGTSTAWNTEGNYQTDSTLNFIGTKDNFPLIFKTSNMERMRISKTGKVRIGNTTIPAPVLFSVFGDINDTIIAHFSNNNPSACLIDILNYSSGYAGLVMRSGWLSFAQDTGFIAMKQNQDLSIYSTKDISLFSRDSIKVYGLDNVSIGSNKNISFYTIDTIGLYGRTRLDYTSTSNTDNALTINFFPNGYFSAAMEINHTVLTSTATSHGIYLNNYTSNTSTGTSVGLGSYSIGNGNKRGLDIYTTGNGNNISIFTHADTGTINIDGYSNWSIYSNSGNIMIKDGHIKSTASTMANAPTVSSSSVTATLSPTSTDVKGIISYTINSGVLGTITVTFAKSYSQPPTVVFSYSESSFAPGSVIVRLGTVDQYKFEIRVYNSNFSTNYTGEIHYHVIE